MPKIMKPKVHLCSVTTISLTLRSFLREQLLFLQQHGFDITVVCSYDSAFEKDLSSTLEYRPVEMARSISFLASLRSVFLMYSLFKRERFDMIQYSTPKAALVASVAGYFAGVPVRLYCQWGIRYVGFTGWKRSFFKLFEKLTCLLSTHISPDSFGNREFSIAEGLYSKGKSSVVYHGSANGVNLARFDHNRRTNFREEMRREIGIETEFVFGWVGRVTKDKGVHELISAFVDIASNEDSILLMIGDMEENHGLPTSTIQLLFNHPRIKYLGRKGEIEKYYSAMDVLVVPSYREGFGVVALEAQAMGVPVITTDIPGPREAVIDGKTGILVPPATIQPLADAMKKLYDDPLLLSKMSGNGIQYVRENFDQVVFWEKVLEHRQWLLTKS